MRTTMRFFAYAFLVSAITLTSCSKDGKDGLDGQDGQDGIAGEQGEQGPAGQDGNANVQTLLFDMSEQSGLSIVFDVPEFTQSVLDKDAILYYLVKGNIHYPIPGPGPNAEYVIRVFARVATARISFNEWDGSSLNGGLGIAANEFDQLKIVIIESNAGSSTGKGASQSKQDIIDELMV